VLSSLPCPSSSTDPRAELSFFGAPDCLERINFRSPLRNRDSFSSSLRAGCDLKRPKETTIEAVLVKERKQYAVAVSLGRCSSERGLLELVLSGHTVARLASALAHSFSLFRGLKALLCFSSESLLLASSRLPGFALLLSVDSSGFVIPVLFLC
ncbi:unnamed protein product, partial [Musa textilis]